MKQRIQNMNLKNKRVILRLDLNVPINNGQILDDTKIVASLETIYKMSNFWGSVQRRCFLYDIILKM